MYTLGNSKEGEEFLMKKAPLKTLGVLSPIRFPPQQKEAPTGNTPIQAVNTPLQAVTNRFLRNGEN